MAFVVASFLGNRFLIGTGRAKPCIDTPDETIDGFTELDVTVQNIKDPVAKKKLEALAKRIVASQGTSERIIGFEVHGHADVDLRVKEGELRTKTELDVSRDRADNAHDLLIQMISDAGGKAFLQGIKANSPTLGVGSKCRKVIPANTEAEMKRNRRVEIFLKIFRNVPAPAQPPIPPPPPKPPEKGFNWIIQIDGGTIVTASSPLGEVLGFATMKLNVTLIDDDRKLQAKFTATGTGLSVSGSSGASSALGSATVLKGSPIRFKTKQVAVLAQFNGDLTLGQNPSLGVSVLTGGGKFVFFFDALPFGTDPKPVEVDAGDDPLGLPQVSLGIASASGSFKLVGQPQAVTK